MEVKTTHHIDAGDKDSQGRYQYYYEYDVFCFTDGEIALTVRSYSLPTVELDINQAR